MRQPGLLLRVTVLVVSGLAAAAAVLAVSSRSELADAKARVDTSWSGLRPSLDQRYTALGQAGDAARSRLGGDRPLLADIRMAVSAWPGSHGLGACLLRDAARHPVEAQVKAAARLEGLAARLAVLVEATPRLRSSRDVEGALGEVSRSDPTGGRQGYNQAVAAYDGVRGGFPRRLVAGALGFNARRTLEVPV